MNSEQIIIDGLVIEIIRKPIKHLYLRIRADDARVIASAPIKMPITTIRQFLLTKTKWLRSRINKPRSNPSNAFDSSENLLYLGCIYPVIDSDVLKPHFTNQQFYAKKPLSETHVKHWYKQRLHELAAPLLQQWQLIIGVTVKDWVIRSMKSRWGSCNTRAARICLNLHLIKYPLPCLEYVIVHELVHLLEASHNRRFYQYMESFMPDWKLRHQRLHQTPIDSPHECELQSA